MKQVAGRGDALERERAMLEARVYSRAGADDPRAERIDPASGRTLLVTESEWRLIELEHRMTRDGGPVDDAPAGGALPAAPPDAAGGPGPVTDGSRGARVPRRPGARALLAVLAIGVGAVAVSLAAGSAAPPDPSSAPEVEVVVGPAAPRAGGAIAGRADRERGLGTMAAFHDPALVPEVRDGLVEAAYPTARAARIVGADGPFAGVAIYALATDDRAGCLVARIGSKGMAVKCAMLRVLASEGLTLSTRIPAGLGHADDPGDGLAADAPDTDLLTAEWHGDGTFRIARWSE